MTTGKTIQMEKETLKRAMVDRMVQQAARHCVFSYRSRETFNVTCSLGYIIRPMNKQERSKKKHKFGQISGEL